MLEENHSANGVGRKPCLDTIMYASKSEWGSLPPVGNEESPTKTLRHTFIFEPVEKRVRNQRVGVKGREKE
mgnify:CR=1 FL=1